MTKAAEEKNRPGEQPRAGTNEKNDHEEDRAVRGNGQDGNVPLSVTPKDVFDDLPNFRLRQSFDRAKTRKPLTTVSIRKPKAHEWFRSHPDPTFRYEGTMFLAKEESLSDEWFFPVTDEVIAELERLSVKGLKNVLVFWWINRKNHTAVWPVTLTDSDGRQNDWHASMQEMLNVHGCGQWCRIEFC